MPARLVMHKTSTFNGVEKEGFMRAAEDERLEVLDLVSVRRSGTRILRAGESPMVRGTAMFFDGKSGIVYLKGPSPISVSIQAPTFHARSSLPGRMVRPVPPSSHGSSSNYPN